MPLWTLENGIHVGDIIKPHSYLGSIKVAFLFSGLERVIKAKSFIFIEFMEKPVPFLVESVQWSDDKTAMLRLVDIDSDITAEGLRDRRIIIPENSIPARVKKQMQPLSTYEGFSVQGQDGKYLGIVMEVIENSQQALLEVENEGRSFLIPIHDDLISDVILEEKILIVDLPEGLLDLND